MHILQADTYLALKAINGHLPYDKAYALETVGALHDKLRVAQEAEIHAQNVAARGALVARRWSFQELILGIKSQVKALYGADSDEVAALGLNKKSERKARPGAGWEEGNGNRGLGRRWCVWGSTNGRGIRNTVCLLSRSG